MSNKKDCILIKHFLLILRVYILFNFNFVIKYLDEDEDAHAALPPPTIHFLRRGSTAEPGSMLMPSTIDRAKGRRHSELELEHEASAPQTPHSHVHKGHTHKGGPHHAHHSQHRPIHGVHRYRSGKKSTESGAPSSIVSIVEDDQDNLEGEEGDDSGKSSNGRGMTEASKRYPTIAINLENEFEKL